jgi:mono/diheme cytochrome c family protein
MRINKYIPNLLLLLLLAAGCNDNTTRNTSVKKTFVPDQKYLSNSVSVNDEKYRYPYPKTNEGYEQAGTELKNPLPATKNNLDKGRQIFEGHCAHCHGLTGNADAPMILKGKYPPPPPFYIRLMTINEGKMFHSITLGRNFMPAHADDLNTEERWQVISYISKTFRTRK